jgi:predicted TIM-barrel fold metal-dependent hydrolase
VGSSLVSTRIRSPARWMRAGVCRITPMVGIDRVLFTTDYPYGSMKAARPFFDRMPINANDREKIAHLNAERLLGLGQDAAHLRRAAE